MDYHPGGWDELVKGAGRDATDMFNEIHRFVANSHCCCLGPPGLENQSYLPKSLDLSPKYLIVHHYTY